MDNQRNKRPFTPGSLTDRTLSSFLWTFGGIVGQATSQLIVVAILARLLVPSDFGAASAALIVIGFLQIFGQLGIGPALIQRPKLEDQHISTGVGLSIVLGLLAGVLVFAFAPLVADFFRLPDVKDLVRVMAIAFPLDAISVVNRSLMQREMRFRELAIVETVSYAIGYGVVGIVLALLQFGVWALVLASIGQSGVRTLLLLILSRHRFSIGFNATAAKQLMHYGIGLSISRIGNYFAIQGDNAVVGRWLGATALGVYGRAYQLIVMPANLFGSVIDQVLFPAMASVQDDKTRLGRAFLRSVTTVAMVTLPVSAMLIVLAPELIALILGPRWQDVVLPFQILSFGMMFRTSYKMGDSLARATGQIYKQAWRQWFYAALVIGGALIGQRWGSPGVAAGVVFAVGANFFMMLQLSMKIVDLRWLELGLAHLRHLVIAILVGIVCYIAARTCREFSFPAIATLLASGAASGALLLLLLVLRPSIFGAEGAWAWSIAASKFRFLARLQRRKGPSA